LLIFSKIFTTILDTFMSDTAEDLQEGMGNLRARAGRGGGEMPVIETREEQEVTVEEEESTSTLCGRLRDILVHDQLACDVQVRGLNFLFVSRHLL